MKSFETIKFVLIFGVLLLGATHLGLVDAMGIPEFSNIAWTFYDMVFPLGGGGILDGIQKLAPKLNNTVQVVTPMGKSLESLVKSYWWLIVVGFVLIASRKGWWPKIFGAASDPVRSFMSQKILLPITVGILILAGTWYMYGWEKLLVSVMPVLIVCFIGIAILTALPKMKNDAKRVGDILADTLLDWFIYALVGEFGAGALMSGAGKTLSSQVVGVFGVSPKNPLIFPMMLGETIGSTLDTPGLLLLMAFLAGVVVWRMATGPGAPSSSPPPGNGSSNNGGKK